MNIKNSSRLSLFVLRIAFWLPLLCASVVRLDAREFPELVPQRPERKRVSDKHFFQPTKETYINESLGAHILLENHSDDLDAGDAKVRTGRVQ